MDLNNRVWSTLNGAYNIPYNPSLALKKLKDSRSQGEQKIIFDELWANLHHEGAVGTASYLASPSLVAICIDKKSLDWNYIGLCVVIEHCRLAGHNPEIPQEYNNDYFEALSQFEKYLLANFKNITDQIALRLALALFATVNGQPGLGKAIELLDEDLLPEFLEQH